MTTTQQKPKFLTAKNSNLYTCTKRQPGQRYSDNTAQIIHIRARSWEHAQLICRRNKYRLDGLLIQTIPTS